MTLRLLKNHQAKKAYHESKQKKRVRVPFTKWQYDTVHAFLNNIRESGKVEEELGAPITVEVDWSHENMERMPHVYLQGKDGYKTIPLKDILEAAAVTLPDENSNG
jgi:hypothetical protein